MKWISNSINESKSLKDHYTLHSIDIIVKDALPDNIDIDFVSNKPFLIQNDSSHQIFNLHIHQKNLEKYSFN